MHVFIILRVALKALARNKMRSTLTMLGIVIGVSAVIAMVAVGQGAENQVQEQIKSFGTNTVFVSAGSPSRRLRHSISVATARAARSIVGKTATPWVSASTPASSIWPSRSTIAIGTPVRSPMLASSSALRARRRRLASWE